MIVEEAAFVVHPAKYIGVFVDTAVKQDSWGTRHTSPPVKA
jgi:hypothetical protein